MNNSIVPVNNPTLLSFYQQQNDMIVILTKKRKPSPGYIPMDSVANLDQIDEQSASGPVLLFKHSTRCGISHSALDQLDHFMKKSPYPIYLLDLINYRDVSNEIAGRYGVPHQSPQILVIVNGQVVKHTSHHAIDVKWLTDLA